MEVEGVVELNLFFSSPAAPTIINELILVNDYTSKTNFNITVGQWAKLFGHPVRSRYDIQQMCMKVFANCYNPYT